MRVGKGREMKQREPGGNELCRLLLPLKSGRFELQKPLSGGTLQYDFNDDTQWLLLAA